MKKLILIVACLGLFSAGAFCQTSNSQTTQTGQSTTTKNTTAKSTGTNGSATKTTATSNSKATAAKAKKQKPKPPVQPPTQYFCPKCHEASQTADACPHCGLQRIKEGTYYCKTCFATGGGPGKCVKCDKEMVPIDGRP